MKYKGIAKLLPKYLFFPYHLKCAKVFHFNKFRNFEIKFVFNFFNNRVETKISKHIVIKKNEHCYLML